MRYYGARLAGPADVSKLLQRGLDLFPQRTALVTQDGDWSWQALDEMSSAYAAGLLRLGFAPGDRIASLLPNCGKLFVHILGILKAGIVGVPLNYRYTPFEIDHALDVSGARGIVYDLSRLADIEASERCRDLAFKLAFDTNRWDTGDDCAPLLAEPAGAFPPVDADAPALMFFTSGSTGPAKGVTHSARTLGYIVASGGLTFQISPDDRFMAGSSCSHIGGFANVLLSWWQGAMALAPRVGNPRRQLEMMRTWKPTLVTMLPAALFELERSAEAVADDFASLRLVGSGGDKVPEQLESEFTQKTGLPIDEIYGMTEIGLSHVNPSSGLVKFGSFGRTSPGYMSEVRDEDGRPLPCGEEGRLWIKFPGTTIGYWARPDATAEVYDADGWFDTGDVVRVDEEGFFYFCGRRKQIIVHNGSNIFPQEVEDALLQHDAVSGVGVIGLHDQVHGENVRAYVSLRAEAAAPSKLELIAFAAERIGYKAPEEIVFLPELPLNPTGKVDRVALKQVAAATH